MSHQGKANSVWTHQQKIEKKKGVEKTTNRIKRVFENEEDRD